MKIINRLLTISAISAVGIGISYRKWLDISDTLINADIKNNTTICLISDLHDFEYGKDNIVLLRTIKERKPDYVTICGDLTNSYANHTDTGLKLVKNIKNLGIPVVYVKGNHELIMSQVHPDAYKQFIKELKAYGAVILDDENYETETINFIGYTNKMKQYGKFRGIYKLSKDELSAELNKKHGNLIKKDKYNIMLAHNPVYLREYADYNADLVLSGHLHGGIVRLPFVGGIMSPQTFFGRRYSAGLYKEGSCHMYVSRGLGVHTIPLRFFNRPELAFITIKRRDS